jgi:GH25 family lysozyme M1 (1,4-beta-N-acetylmuramidase)
MISPESGVEIPADALNISLDIAFTRAQDPDAIKRLPDLPPNVADARRITLDHTLRGTVELDQWVPGTPIQVRVLSPSGAVRVSKSAEGVADKPLEIQLTRADVALATAPEPQPPAAPAVIDRRATFVPVGDQPVSFAGSRLLVAPMSAAGNGWQTLGLDTIFHTGQAVSTAVPWRDALPAALGGLAWADRPLTVGGQFDFSVPAGAGDGWLWLLGGPIGAFGAMLDDLSTVVVTRITVALPPLRPVMSTGDRTPTPETDAEVAANPDVYTEDPGEFCRPFTNPERVLGERSFFAVLRAEQPQISVGPSIIVDPLPTLTVNVSAVAPTEMATARAVVRPGAVVADETASFHQQAMPAGYQDVLRGLPRGRTILDADNPVQWESDISRYQATTVARGHILEYRMRWRSNGYSLGTVAKTLTLAPRQAKRIQQIDFRRSELSQRQESTQLADQVSDSLTRERDYDDAVKANLSEWERGASSSSTEAGAGGFGFATAGFVIGGGGGASNASSSSSQEGGRRTSAAEDQRLRDSIRRYGDSLRKFDSTVVTEVTEEETVTGTTEIVRNVNYGHSLTVIYYQILRHLKVETAISAVRECVFVPLPITAFTIARAYRWRDAIRAGLRDRTYLGAITYLKDVLTGFAQSDVPPGRRSDQPVRYLTGSLFLRIAVERPRDKDDGSFNPATWALMSPYLGTPALAIYTQLKAIDEAQRDAAFQSQHAPGVAANWVNTLRVSAGATPVPADFTVATAYRFNTVVRVDFTATIPAGTPITRETLSGIKVSATRDLPPGSVANLTNLSFTYDTDQFQRTVTGAAHTDDLVLPETGVHDPAGATVVNVPDSWERQDIRAEMTRAVQNLIEHLNAYVVYYSNWIWWTMDRNQLFMLLDGFFVPGTNQVSIASVVERDPIAIIGNAIVFRVSAGSFLGLGDITTPQELYNYYVGEQPPSEPMLIALPTDGLYAQTVMDSCAAVEEHFGNTDWVLNDPDPALGEIAPELLASRRSDPVATTPTALPQTLINLQNAPDAPAPAGLANALTAVTNANSFRDMAGLAGTQANAAAALQTAAGLASNFGAQAAALKMAEIADKAHGTQTADQKLASVQRASDKQLITPADAQRHANQVLEELHNPSQPARPYQDPVLSQAIVAASGKPGSTISTTTPDGQVSISLASLSTASGGGAGGTVTPTAGTPPAEVASWPLGVDVYELNNYLGAPISAAGFANLKSHGKVFAILKSSQGLHPDGQFPFYYRRAADAGLIRGSFHFFANANPSTDQTNPIPNGYWAGSVADQATLVIRLVKRLGPGDLAPALDLEDQTGALDVGHYPNQPGYQYRKKQKRPAAVTANGRAAIIADAQDFFDRLETALGRTPIMYTSVMWMDDDEMGNPPDLAAYPLWTVNHERRNQFPHLVDISVGGWGTNWDIIQYAEGGKGPYFGVNPYDEAGIGIDGCDFDAYRGTLAGLRGLADLGRPAAAMTSALSFVAHAEADGTLHVRSGPNWVDDNLSLVELYGTLNDPDMLASGTDAFLYYRRDDHVMEASSIGGGPWSQDAIDDGIAPFNNPRALVDGTRRHVAYWGVDDDWHHVTFDGAWSSSGNVLTLAGVKTAAGGFASGQPVPYLLEGAVHLVGRVGTDGHLMDVWSDGVTWHNDDLTVLGRASAAAMPAATYTPTVANVAATAWVVFRGVRGELWAIKRDDNSAVNLTQATNGQLALGHPAAFTFGTDQPHVIYRGADHLIHDIWLESGQWHMQEVCQDLAAADPAVAGNGSSAVVAIRAMDNALHVAQFDGTGWTCTATPPMQGGGLDLSDGSVIV